MKKFVFAVLSFVFCLAVFSCASEKNAIVFDDSLSIEETATIYWAGNQVRPVVYNGIRVNWRLAPFGYNIIKIPAGPTTFEITGRTRRMDSIQNLPGAPRNMNSVEYIWREYPFTYNFEKGKEYTISIPLGEIRIFNGKSDREKDLLVSIK